MDAPHEANRRVQPDMRKQALLQRTPGCGPTTANATSALGTDKHPSAATGATPVFYTLGASAMEMAMLVGGHN